MNQIVHTDSKGRRYRAFKNGEDVIVSGPPEGLVDSLKLPEPFATKLHNILYDRGIYTFADISRNPNNLKGALQEALTLDMQILSEAFFNYEGGLK